MTKATAVHPEKNAIDLSEKALLFRYHDAFYKIFHLPLDWIPPDNRSFTVCGKSHCNGLCTRIMESEEGTRLCRELDAVRIQEAQRTGKPVITPCHAGFYDATIPIMVDGVYLGSLCFGQYLRKQPTARQIRLVEKRLSFLRFRPGELASFYKETRTLSKEEEEGLMELLQMLGTYICETYGRWQFLEALRQSDPILEATEYIHHHYAQNLTVDGLARSVCMSKSHFIHRFTDQVGDSPIAYLNRYRISRATEMLQKSKMSVSQIALQCGFSSIRHFNSLFKRHAGMTPMEMRLQYSKNSKS